jgi:UDP-2,3-diacylglucosamine pyrophosphatase LpxH
MTKSSKEDVVLQLKMDWTVLHPVDRKVLIYSLLGHRMSFAAIALGTNRTVDEIRNAYKYVPESSVNLQGTISDCGNSAGYQGLVAPTCAGGGGCQKCWAIFNNVNHIDTGFVSPKVTEVAPIKAIYSLDFDEILHQYRQFVGWNTHMDTCPKPGQGPNDERYLEGIIISDIHAPFHDEDAFSEMIQQTKGKVDICVLAGDGPDFHNYSKYMKYGQHFTIQDEHKSFLAVLAVLSESFPEVVMIPGNHDERTRKKYAQLLPADLYQALLSFHGNNTFDFSELMTLQFDNIIIPEVPSHGFAEYRFLYQVNDIVIGHPEVFSKIANKSVSTFIDWLKKKAEPMGLVKPFSAAVMGHTHQAGKTFNDYDVIGIENGCLCLTPDYDSGAKLSGAMRPVVTGYTRFRTNRLTGKTAPNDINFVRI